MTFLARLYKSTESCCCHPAFGMRVGVGDGQGQFYDQFLARLDEVQEELLYYPQRWRRR